MLHLARIAMLESSQLKKVDISEAHAELDKAKVLLDNAIRSCGQAENDICLREIYQKSLTMEADVRALEAMKAKLIFVQANVQRLSVKPQELTGWVQALTSDLNRATTDLLQLPGLNVEIKSIKQEFQQVRVAMEYEKKGYTENYERGQVMEKNLILISCEMEKLRAEVANAEKRVPVVTHVDNLADNLHKTFVSPWSEEPAKVDLEHNVPECYYAKPPP